MASLKITRADGTVTTHEVTPAVEYAFEQQFRKGFHKAFREDEKQEHILDAGRIVDEDGRPRIQILHVEHTDHNRRD